MAGPLLEHVKLLCPMSGQEVEDPTDPGIPKIVNQHFMMATACKTGKGIFLRCPYHMIHAFITHPLLVARYLSNGKNGQAKRQGK